MSRKGKLRRYSDLVIAAVVLTVYVGLSFLIPMQCPIQWLTGISCPGCGITRALTAFCKLDFAAAWYYHPVIFYLIPAAPVLLIAYLRNAKKLTEVLLWVTVGVMIAVYLYRLLVLHSPVVKADFSEGWIGGLFR